MVEGNGSLQISKRQVAETWQSPAAVMSRTTAPSNAAQTRPPRPWSGLLPWCFASMVSSSKTPAVRHPQATEGARDGQSRECETVSRDRGMPKLDRKQQAERGPRRGGLDAELRSDDLGAPAHVRKAVPGPVFGEAGAVVAHPDVDVLAERIDPGLDAHLVRSRVLHHVAERLLQDAQHMHHVLRGEAGELGNVVHLPVEVDPLLLQALVEAVAQ